MENSEEKHDGSHPTRKSKSFDLLGLHEEKSEASFRSRETRPTEENGVPHGHLGKKRRNDSPPSAIQSVVKTHLEDSSISGSFSYGFDSGFGKSDNLSGSRGISCIPHGVNNASEAPENVSVLPLLKTDKSNLSSNGRDLSTLGGDANVPRRPRGVLKGKNSPTIKKEASGIFTSIRKKRSRSSNSKLSSHPIIPTQQGRSFVGKRKKRYDDKENGSSRCNSVEHTKPENASSLDKIHKKIKRSRRQRQDASTEKLKHVVSEAISFEDYHEDDEESLEQNAARMLSSRFDPRCTELSGDKSSFPSRSQCKSSSSSSLTQGGRKNLGSVLSSPNAQARELQPRKKRRKGYVKEEKHFYEVFTRTVDPYWVLKRRISVFWPLDQSWYLGLVKDYDPTTRLHHVKYDDRDEEWINLQGERFKLLLLPSEFMSKFCQGKLEFTVKEENVDGTLNTMDDNSASSVLESEPIISWLGRSTSRLKTSSSSILRDRRKSRLKQNPSPSLLDSKEHAIVCPSGTNSKMHSTVSMPDGSADEKTAEFPPAKKKRNCYDEMKFSRVYFRRRSCKKLETLKNKLEEKDELCDFPYSTKLSASVLSGHCSLDHEASDITFTTLKQRERKLMFMLPLQWVSCLAWLSEYSWLYKNFLLYHHGKLLPLWPPICMEIVFLDNNLGLRFLSVEGHLLHAVTVLCLFIRIFHQPNLCSKFTAPQLPVTSIGFKLSPMQGEGRQLLFYVYKFLNTHSSQWLYLGRKLKQLSVKVKVLPLSQCTYASLKEFFRADEKRPYHSDSWQPITLEVLLRLLIYPEPLLPIKKEESSLYFTFDAIFLFSRP